MGSIGEQKTACVRVSHVSVCVCLLVYAIRLEDNLSVTLRSVICVSETESLTDLQLTI